MQSTWSRVVFVMLFAMVISAMAAGIGAAEEPKVKLQFWHHWTNSYREGWVQSMLDNFMAANPSIEVEHIATGTAGAADKLAAFLVAGAGPEVVMVRSSYATQLMAMGGFVQLNELMQQDGIDPRIFIPADLSSFQLKGGIYALPAASGSAWTNLMFYNKDVMAEVGLNPAAPPATWNDWRTAAKRMTKKTSDGTLTRAGTDVPHLDVAGPWNGAQFWSDDWAKATVDTPQAQQTIEFLSWLTQDIYGTLQARNNFHSGTTRFYTGELGLWFMNNSAFGALKDKDVDWGVALAPINSDNPGTKPVGTVASTWAYAIPTSVSAEKREAAWKLLTWLTVHEEAGGWFNRIQGRPSPVIAFNNHSDYLRENPQWRAVIEAASYDIPTPPGVNLSIVRQASVRVIGQNVAPQQSLLQAEIELQVALDQYWEIAK